MPDTSLESPTHTPQELWDKFPRLEPSLTGTELFRIFRAYDPESGAPRYPFFFSPAPDDPDDGGRFDLPSPHGCCYLGLSVVAAWLEVFRSTTLVDIQDVRSRRLCIAAAGSVPTADLLSPTCRVFGITGEIHVTDDYRLPREWSNQLFRAGFKALRYKARHDPSLEHRSVALMDKEGAHTPFGESWEFGVYRLDELSNLLALVSQFGFRVAPVPHDMMIDDPSESEAPTSGEPRLHEHRFVESPGGIGIQRWVCEDCGYVSIRV